MSYNFNFAVSATISAKVVEEMVKQIVEEQTGRKVKSVAFKTKNQYSGYGRDEYTTTVFDGCTVDFETDSAPKRKTSAPDNFSGGGYR